MPGCRGQCTSGNGRPWRLGDWCASVARRHSCGKNAGQSERWTVVSVKQSAAVFGIMFEDADNVKPASFPVKSHGQYNANAS
jgi:hypothetical protein